MTTFAAVTANAQEKKKEYRSAESGRYVTKKQAEKNPSTTYSTTRKSGNSKRSK
ncbi:MAG: multidrug transporter [Flavobacterium sp.]|nr:multidrug transporter [Flavobacterium sp.]